MDTGEFQATIGRKAIVMEIGGFRPPQDRRASMFGQVDWSLPGESWPVCEGSPMLALCQLNLLELPFRPPRLDDVAMLTVFVRSNRLPASDPNGSTWCLRSYASFEGLQPLERPDHDSPIRPFPMRHEVVDQDYPCWEDIPCEVPAAVHERYADLFGNADGFKLGGWPSLIQGDVAWAPDGEDQAAPEYVFQIDSSEKANWYWGHGGVGYFGRGTGCGHTDEWMLEWQCL